MKVGIIANGNITDIPFSKEILSICDYIICADGGANYIEELNIKPDIIIGDMDSIKNSVKEKYKEIVKVVNDQDSTDLQKAITLAKTKNPDKIIILGAIGNRMDHTMANMLTIEENMEIVDPHNEITMTTKSIEFEGNTGDVVSVIAVKKTKGLTYKGLKWGVNHIDVEAGWIGTSNEMIEKKASITFESGKLLVIKSKGV